MTEPFLIAHKVRGEPAFDIAHRMTCPECETKWREGLDGTLQCVECDQLGYWWIVSTSGHRAYPFFAEELRLLIDWEMARIHGRVVGDMPSDLPDHYPTRTAPTLSLAEALGFTGKPKPKDTSRPFPRRL